jgi:ABC-2 type transport system permease protein
MFRFLAAVRKEGLLLLRDRAGLIILFVMPMILIVMMSLLQESGWNSFVHESKVPVVFVDNDGDSLGIRIREGLVRSNFFRIIDSIGSKPATKELATEAVKSGRYEIGIVIPSGLTKALRANVRITVAKTLAGFGMFNSSLVSGMSFTPPDSVLMIFDPAVRTSFKTGVISSIRENNYRIETQMVFRTFIQEISKQFPGNNMPPIEFREAMVFKELYPTYKAVTTAPNTVQHNVPAWTIFSMFFIIIPLTSSMIKEREEGSLIRLLAMPVPYMRLLLSKSTVYFFVCLIQAALMILSGIYILPLFHVPMLDVGGQIFPLVLVSVATALAALGYGLMVGTLATTHQQAAAFGSVSVIILAALGGIWVPIYLMPEVMRHVATLSPLNWAINGYYSIFLRGGSVLHVLPEVMKLVLFFLFTLMVTSVYRHFKSPLKR